MEENFTLPANTSAFCLNVGAYNVCMTIPCRYFREKLHVLIPLWGVVRWILSGKLTKGHYLEFLPWFLLTRAFP